MKMNFGKYDKWDVNDVPIDYFQWMKRQGITVKTPALAEAIDRRLRGEAIHDDELQRLREENGHLRLQLLTRSGLNSATLNQVYRQMTLKYHPDRGGSVEAMCAVNDIFDELMRLC